jgi:transcriptional regulator with XRE-family HTH domain
MHSRHGPGSHRSDGSRTTDVKVRPFLRMRGIRAGTLWYLDHSLAELGRSFPAPPLRGWVRTIREGLGLSGSELGVRLGVSQPRISQIERAELDGTLQLGTLERVAAAMHCELRYAFIPKEPLEGLAQELALLKAYGWREAGPQRPEIPRI